MRIVVGTGLMLFMTCAVVAADDIDVKKLLGKWEHEKEKFVIDFAKDGKLSVTGDKGGETFSVKGTYKVEKNKLTLVVDLAGKEKTVKRIVSKLTDTELVSKEEGEDREDTLKRVKEEKKKEK